MMPSQHRGEKTQKTKKACINASTGKGRILTWPCFWNRCIGKQPSPSPGVCDKGVKAQMEGNPGLLKIHRESGTTLSSCSFSCPVATPLNSENRRCRTGHELAMPCLWDWRHSCHHCMNWDKSQQFLPWRVVIARRWKAGKGFATWCYKSEWKELHYTSWKQKVHSASLNTLCILK